MLPEPVWPSSLALFPNVSLPSHGRTGDLGEGVYRSLSRMKESSSVFINSVKTAMHSSQPSWLAYCFRVFPSHSSSLFTFAALGCCIGSGTMLPSAVQHF